MKRFLCGLAAGLLAGGVVVSAQGRTEKVTAGSDRVGGSVRITFSTQDLRVIHEYYEPRYRTLPRGLQKKLARREPLPPGWQKKFELFPSAVERRLMALPHGFQRGVVDGHAVIFDDVTHVLLDVAVLF